MPVVYARFTSVPIAIIIGAAYGILCQAAFRFDGIKDLHGIMSFGYIFILPLMLGVLTLWYASPRFQRSWLFRIFGPWCTSSICLAVSVIVGWEGAICLIFAAMIMLPLSSIGGLVTGLILARRNRTRIDSAALVGLLLIPTISAFIENQFKLPVQYSGARTEILIHAPARTVWENIIRVPKITEPLQGVFYQLGFPKPVEATLSHEGVGGVREASFERGLVFTETVDVWEHEKKLSFAIKVAPNSVPPSTLDEHVVVGGRYFDVLRGTYEIENIAPGVTRLILYSNFRVSTRFNFYAGFLGTFLMRDIQETILAVIKQRAEGVAIKLSIDAHPR